MTRITYLLVALLLIAPANAFAAQPLVSADWLAKNHNSADVRVLDVRGNPELYVAGHVPGAVLTSYQNDGWRVRRGDVVGMLPDMADLSSLIGRLGVSNSDHVVLVAQGKNATEMGIATRIFWTFKVAGHERVSLLDGGFGGYNNGKRPVSQGGVSPKPATFKASLNKAYLATEADVAKAVADGSAKLIDHRPLAHYTGAQQPGPVARAGTIPGSSNAPALDMTKDGKGFMKDADALKAMYADAGAATDGAVINFCNTGHWASVGWFVSSQILGNKDAKMYDGSMAEWTRNPDNDVIKATN